MGALVMVEFLSVDGVMQGLGSPDEDRDGGFEHGGWGAPYAPRIHQVTSASGFDRTAGYVFGRKTYEKMAAFWPFQSSDDPMADHLNTAPKYVASRTLTQPEWAGTSVLGGDAVDAVREVVAAAEGDLVVLGSGAFARQLLAADIVDELRLFVHPLLLGTGKRLFGDLSAPRALTLTSVGKTDLGTVALTYSLRQ